MNDCQRSDLIRPARRGAIAAVTLAGAIAALSAAAAAAPAGPSRAGAPPRTLDAYIEATLKEWQVPGAAIAIVENGRVTTKGYGVRELGKPERVDENTLFDVASLTKSFTAAGIGTLVDEGRMAWDAPVQRYLPALEFPDPYLTANVTVRDLLCHRTGIRPTNWAWSLTQVTRPQLLTLVDSMTAAAPFRSRLVYWNIGYTIAGEASAAVAGVPWERLVTDRLFVPLGMTRTTAYFDSVPALGNYTTGHAMIGGEHRVVPRETARTSTAPAGVIHSSASDLARWLSFHLGDGTVGGRRILASETLEEMHALQLVIRGTAAFRAQRQIRYFGGYGLGWQVMDYRGHPIVWHSGNGDGHLAYMVALPEDKLGVAVLVNSWRAGPALNGSIAARILDHYLKLPTRDYAAELREGWERNERRRADDRKALENARVRNTSPSLPLQSYAGSFRDPLGLELRVWLESDTLRMRYGGGEPATLIHWHHDTFRARWQNPFHDDILPTFAAFGSTVYGTIDRVRFAPYVEEIEAKRMTP